MWIIGPRTAIKGHALINFIAEFTYSYTTKVAGTTGNAKAAKRVETKNGRTFATKRKNSDDTEQWNPYVDGASNETGSGVGMMPISPKGHKIHCALYFGF